jgi:hypothetical protein
MSTGTCGDCGDPISPRDACFAVCAARGDSLSTCTAVCQ